MAVISGLHSCLLVLLLALAAVANAAYNCVPFEPATRSNCNPSSLDPRAYYPTTNAMYKDACKITNLPSNLQQTIDTLFPETKHPDPATLRSDIYMFFTSNNANLSFTYASSITANTNGLGYAFYDAGRKVVLSYHLVFPKLNNIRREGCLVQGDTFRFGPFNQNDMILFYLYRPGSPAMTFWSYMDPPSMTNPDTSSCSPNGCVHSAWAYIPDADITLFGFEDGTLGDADYNDLVFFLQLEGNATFNQVPEYGGGTIKVCNFNTAVTEKSLALVDCVQWGLLESTTSQSCLTYMAIPAGFTWAKDDTASRAAISSLASQWSYSSAKCYLLSTDDTGTNGIGRKSDGSLCASGEYKISTIVNGTAICYNAQCTSRFVLRGANLGAGCTASLRCNPNSAGSLISSSPTSGAPSNGIVMWPTQVSAFLRGGDGTFSTSTSLTLPGGSSTTQKIDVIIFADFSGVPSNKIQTVISSYASMASTFSPEYLDPRFAFVQFNPSGSSYSLTSDWTFKTSPSSLTSTMFPTNGACPSNNNTPRNIYAAIAEAMRNPALNAGFRVDAFKTMWIHASCFNDVTASSAVYNAAVETGIVPVFAFAGSSSGTSVPSQYSPSGTGVAVPLQVVYKSGDSWASPFATVSSSNSNPKGAGAMRYLPFRLLGIATSGASFVSGLSTTASTQATVSGTASISYSLKWPSSVTDYSVDSYSTTVRIMGRGTTVFTISFNHPPSLPDVTYTFTGRQNQTITLTPTDPDGNLMNIMVTDYPDKGTLFTPDGSKRITNTEPLEAGVYSMLYVPSAFQFGSDSVSVSAFDGCVGDPGNVGLTINYANNPPNALDFTIVMQEDSTGDVGLIDFSSFISDIDIAQGQDQTLTVNILTNPTPTGKGTLTNAATNQALAGLGNIDGYKLRFNLTRPRSGWGLVTFNYQVSDNTNQGNALSRVATVTIDIKHVNHAPILTIPNRDFAIKVLGATPTTISAFVTDYDDGDQVNLYATLTNITSFEVKADRALNSGSKAQLPFNFYSANISSITSNYPLNNLVWQTPTVGAIESITFRAQDQTGAWSNEVEVFLRTIESNPPSWTFRPLNSSFPYPSLNITQGDQLNGLYFAAKDDDSDQYKRLKFVLVAAPSSGSIEIVRLNTGSNQALSLNGQLGNNINSNFVGLTSTESYFRVNYIPQGSFFGTDTFSFTVTDEEGRSASEAATVVVNVARRLTAPQSGDVEIRTLEEQPGSAQISLGSTNDATWPVYLTLETLNFDGALMIAGQPWIPGMSLNETTLPFVTVSTISGLGVYSKPDQNTQVGNFTYSVHENLSGLSGTRLYTGKIYIEHVNHAPQSANQGHTIKRRVALQVTIPATDPDQDDPQSTLVAKFTSISPSSKGKFFFDAQMTRELNSSTLDQALAARSFWYISNDDFSSNNLPLASYRFVVIDKLGDGLSSQIYDGSITVLPAGDLPVPGILDAYTYQETPLPMVLAIGTSTETGQAAVISITSPPKNGTFAVCALDGTCTTPVSYPTLVTSTSGRVVFVPRDADWGMNFTSFDFTLTDPGSNAVGIYTMRIHVIHVNKRPKVFAANFLTTAETTAGIIINESQWRSFDWVVSDVDSLPSVLTTSVRASFYTSQGFKIYSCQYHPGHWNASLATTCDFNIDTDTAFAGRDSFARNARVSVPSFELVTSDCSSAEQLKARLGAYSRNCEAHFKFVFAPTPLSSFTPYVALTFSGIDDEQAESSPITALIYVKAINTAPVIWSPSIVLGGQGINNPFIIDTAADSPTFNNPVSVNDVDSNGNIELLTITVNDGYSGNLVWPESAPCIASTTRDQQWLCRDRIVAFNQWLKDIRFEVTSGDRADITFEINDLGWSSDYRPALNLTDSSTTSIRLTLAVAAPKGNSSTLAIAVGVAAGVGLLLLGALGFFLRRAVAPPADDYFSAATTPLSAAPQSPLYQAQNTEHMNALYKGK